MPNQNGKIDQFPPVFSTLLEENFPGVIFIRKMTPEGEVSYPYFSDTIRTILEMPPFTPLSFSQNGYVLDALHWADKEKLIGLIRKSADDLKSYTEEFRIISKSETIHWLRGTVNVRKQPDGTITWEGVLLDVTEKKQAENRLELILNNTADAILTLDEKGIILSANETMEKMFGYPTEVLLGRSVADILVPEERNALNNYLRTYQFGMAANTQTEHLGLSKNGFVFPIEFSLSSVRWEGKRWLFVLLVRDIAERKRTEETLKETESRLGAIVSALPCMLFTTALAAGEKPHYVYVSEGIRTLLGFSPQRMKSLGFSPESVVKDPSLMKQFLFPQEQEDPILGHLRSCLLQNKAEIFDQEFKLPSGRWIHVRSRPELLTSGGIINHGIIIDITDRRQAQDLLSYLAYNDSVTGTGNRAYLMKEFPNFIERAKENGTKIAVISLMQDRLGQYYAHAGYDVGDQLIALMASEIKNVIREGDCVTYASGNRFIILLNNIREYAEAEAVIKSLVNTFSKSFIVNMQEFDISTSIGVSYFPEHGSDSATLLRHSEAALSNSRKKSVPTSVFTEQLNLEIAENLSLRIKLRNAIKTDEIEPFFQPQINIHTGKIKGMEALARWRSLNVDFAMPSVFIPIAEETGMIESIAEIILEKSCYWASRWATLGHPVPVAVNISSQHFKNPDHLIEMIRKNLLKYELAPSLLELELTESSAMADPKEALDVVNTLKEMGLSCSIDDFGTGYSSLSVLKTFPFKKLKIDRSFVVDISETQENTILKATIAMAKALHLDALAEGVETIEQYEFLKKNGCDSIQGYLFSKPLPAEAMQNMLYTWKPEQALNLLSHK